MFPSLSIIGACAVGISALHVLRYATSPLICPTVTFRHVCKNLELPSTHHQDQPYGKYTVLIMNHDSEIVRFRSTAYI